MLITILEDGQTKTPYEFLEDQLSGSKYSIEQKYLLLETAVNNGLINLNEFLQLMPLLKEVI
jgi:hypothetical protein